MLAITPGLVEGAKNDQFALADAQKAVDISNQWLIANPEAQLVKVYPHGWRGVTFLVEFQNEKLIVKTEVVKEGSKPQIKHFPGLFPRIIHQAESESNSSIIIMQYVGEVKPLNINDYYNVLDLVSKMWVHETSPTEDVDWDFRITKWLNNWKSNIPYSMSKAISIKNEILSELGNKYLHGDLHLENIAFRNSEPTLIDPSLFFCGDPEYDLAELTRSLLTNNRQYDLSALVNSACQEHNLNPDKCYRWLWISITSLHPVKMAWLMPKVETHL